MIPFRPERVFVTDESWPDAAAGAMLQRLAGVPVIRVPDEGAAAAELRQTPDPLGRGKRTLLLARHSGRFMNPCPGDGAEMCCNYRVLNFARNCPMDCSYCALQSFLGHPAVIVYTNLEDLLEEAGRAVSAAAGRILRIGTGDLSDSLALDHITGYSQRLIPFFANFKNTVVELKTKSNVVSSLEGLAHAGRTVVSWSVNSKKIIRDEEFLTASLEERLGAARLCREWGYRIGFHFDPLVCYPGWEEDYHEAVDGIFSAVDPAAIAWISLGGLRFTSQLRDVIRRRFPKSRVTYGEFIPGHHGKWRYFRPIREEMYARIAGWIRRYAPEAFIYLCMENRLAWEQSLDNIPRNASHLSDLMDARVPWKPREQDSAPLDM